MWVFDRRVSTRFGDFSMLVQISGSPPGKGGAAIRRAIRDEGAAPLQVERAPVPDLHAMRNPVERFFRRVKERLTMRCKKPKRNFPSMLRIFAIGRRPNRGRTLVHSGRSDHRRLRTAPVNQPDHVRPTLSSFPRLPRSKPDDVGGFARWPTGENLSRRSRTDIFPPGPWRHENCPRHDMRPLQNPVTKSR